MLTCHNILQTEGDVEFRERKCGSSRGEKCKLSLSLKKKQKDLAEGTGVSTKECFPLLSPDVIEDMKKRIVQKNTEKSTNWAVHLFNSCYQQKMSAVMKRYLRVSYTD